MGGTSPLVMEGVSEEEANERVAAAEELGMGGGVAVKKSAIQVLLDAGARVTPVSENANSEQILLDNLRRQKRNVDVYLGKLGVETEMKKAEPRANARRVERKGKDLDASQKAAETALSAVPLSSAAKPRRSAGDA